MGLDLVLGDRDRDRERPERVVRDHLLGHGHIHDVLGDDLGGLLGRRVAVCGRDGLEGLGELGRHDGVDDACGPNLRSEELETPQVARLRLRPQRPVVVVVGDGRRANLLNEFVHCRVQRPGALAREPSEFPELVGMLARLLAAVVCRAALAAREVLGDRPVDVDVPLHCPLDALGRLDRAVLEHVLDLRLGPLRIGRRDVVLPRLEPPARHGPPPREGYVHPNYIRCLRLMTRRAILLLIA